MINSFFTTIKDKNIAYHVQDIKENVEKAREEIAKKHGYESGKLCYMNQIHSNIVQIVNDTHRLYKCDALVTNKLNTPLMVMVADCIPILFYDEVKSVIAVAHAGREGTFHNISKNTVDTMIETFNCKASHIKVTLGPSIGKCCYEVSKHIADKTSLEFGKIFVNNRNIDLQGINIKQLLEIGIEKENIILSDICTKCANEPYFSYRKDSKCGRFAGVIMMKRSKKKTSS